MTFVKKTWKDRLVEHAGRRMLKRISGDPNETMVVDVTRSEGTVSQEGDAFSGANMNDLEQRIGDAFEEVNNNLKGFTPILDSTGKITGYKTQAGADTVFPFSDSSSYIESITIFGFGNRNTDNPYDIKTFRQVYDPNKIGDQKLLSASGYYQSGWHLNVSVSSKASGYSGAKGTGGIYTTELSTIAWL